MAITVVLKNVKLYPFGIILSIKFYFCFLFFSGDAQIAHFDPSASGSVSCLPTEELFGWCLADDKKKLVAGDYNKDSFTDFVCQGQKFGSMSIMLNQRGEFCERGNNSIYILQSTSDFLRHRKA